MTKIQKSTGKALSIMQRDKSTVLMTKLILTGDVCALECMWVMLELGWSG